MSTFQSDTLGAILIPGPSPEHGVHLLPILTSHSSPRYKLSTQAKIQYYNIACRLCHWKSLPSPRRKPSMPRMYYSACPRSSTGSRIQYRSSSAGWRTRVPISSSLSSTQKRTVDQIRRKWPSCSRTCAIWVSRLQSLNR